MRVRCMPIYCVAYSCRTALHNAAKESLEQFVALSPSFTEPSRHSMSHNVIAVYPGTFDPMTLGHEDVVRRATQLFDRVIVAVAAGHHKRALFSLQERIDMARESVSAYPQVEVESFSGLLRDFVVARGGKAMVRGLRAVTDFDYEFQLAGMNRSLMPQVETVFLTPSDKYQFISSTFVREIALLGGEVHKFVSPAVEQRLLEKVRALAQTPVAPD
jgi:pantetheine-phosphate adenylyltransferase